MNWLKVLITFPYLIRIYTKSKSMTKKILRDPGEILESKRYVWLQKKVKYIKWIYNVKIISHGIENWPKHKGCVLIANHQSNFDPLALLLLNDFNNYAPVGFIAKEELKNNKLAKRFIFLIDVLFINRKDPRSAVEVFKEAKELVRVPRSMVIFPEGTRSHSPKLGEFKPGAFKLAYQAYVPIVPVSIVDSYKVFDKKIKGKKIVHVTFHKPLNPQKFIHIPSSGLANNIYRTISTEVTKLSS